MNAEQTFRRLMGEHPGWGRGRMVEAMAEAGHSVGTRWVRDRLQLFKGRVVGGDGCSLAQAAAIPTGKPDMQVEFGQDKGCVTLDRTRIKTLAEALDAAQVDLDVWEVDRYIVNKWEVGAKEREFDDEGKVMSQRIKVEPLFQVKVWLKRKVVQPLEVALERFTGRLTSAPIAPAPDFTPCADPHMLEVALYDHHFGKYCWAAETGQDYDLTIAERIYVNAAADLLHKAQGFDIDLIALVVGQDFLHINNVSGTTEKGTRQDVDTRLGHVIDTAFRAVTRAVELFRTVSPVVIQWVPGNHDPLTSYFLCRELRAYYRGEGGVEVDVSPRVRKCLRYGVNLLGYTHGDEEPHQKLPTIMATEWPQEWAATKHREWHVGHVHKKKQTHYVSNDSYVGIPVRVLPSLSATDAWHYRKGFIATARAAVANLYSFSRGPAAEFISTLDERDMLSPDTAEAL